MDEWRHEKDRQHSRTHEPIVPYQFETRSQEQQRQDAESRQSVIPDNRAQEKTLLPAQHQAAGGTRCRRIPKSGEISGPIRRTTNLRAAIRTTAAG